jgi:tRNA threonylcarbamoyladenosine biosynthesis protein TsaB
MQLVLDSSGQYLVVGLGQDSQLEHEVVLPAASPEARDLLTVVRALLNEAGVQPTDITQIGVGIGPGSFIGTRAAVSFANGFAAAANLQVYPLPTLAAWAALAPGPVAVLRDARRNEAYLYDSFNMQTELVGISALADRLAGLEVARLVAESPLDEGARAQAWHSAVEEAARAAALIPSWQRHLPAAGLLAMLPLCKSQDYAEPLYLRGFL